MTSPDAVVGALAGTWAAVHTCVPLVVGLVRWSAPPAFVCAKGPGVVAGRDAAPAGHGVAKGPGAAPVVGGDRAATDELPAPVPPVADVPPGAYPPPVPPARRVHRPAGRRPSGRDRGRRPAAGPVLELLELAEAPTRPDTLTLETVRRAC